MLGDGVRLTCITTDKWKKSLLRACFVLPLDDKGRSMAALLPNVLRSNCSRYPGRQRVAIRLDELYGARLEPFVSKRGEAQMVGIMADVVDERFGAPGMVLDTARLVTDILLHPEESLSEASVRREAAIWKARIAALPDNKRTWVVRRMFQLMCADEPYRLVEFGDLDALDVITPEALSAYYQSVLRTAPLELFYCGSMDVDRVEQIFREALSKLPQRSCCGYPTGKNKEAADELRWTVEEEPVKQGKLAIGIRLGMTVTDPLYPALVLFNACFGGNTSSRLFRTVREEKSLCYYASSQTDKLKGVMAVSSGVENGTAQTACEEILRQLSLIQAGDLSRQEIESARRSVQATLQTILDSPYSLENFYQMQSAIGLDSTLEQLTARIACVTADQIAEAACRAKPDFVYFLKGAAQ
jgi:predicted Zn-dependent peptidase